MPLVSDRYLDARRADILQAAKGVFVRKGFAEATMQDIAADAGVSAGSIYRYFASKEDLIRAVTEECEQQYELLFGGADLGAASPLQLLIGAGREVWHALAEPGARDQTRLNLESTLVGARNPQVGASLAQAMRTTRTLLTRLVAQAQEHGELDASFDAEALATLLIAATGGVQILAVQMGEEVDIDATWQVLLRLIEGISREVLR